MADARAGFRQRAGIGDVSRNIAEARGELIPFPGGRLSAAIAQPITELLVGHLIAGDADDVHVVGQSLLLEQAEQRRPQLLMSQVAAGAQDDQGGDVAVHRRRRADSRRRSSLGVGLPTRFTNGVAAELVAEGSQHPGAEGFLLAGAETLVEGGGDGRGGNGQLHGFVDRPPAFTGVVHVGGQALQTGVGFQGQHGKIQQATSALRCHAARFWRWP